MGSLAGASNAYSPLFYPIHLDALPRYKDWGREENAGGLMKFWQGCISL